MANEHGPARAHDDIGEMWRQQPRQSQAVTPEDVRRRAEHFDRKVSGWQLMTTVMVALLVVKNVWEVWIDTDLVERAGDVLMLTALVSMVYRFWRHSRADRVPSTLGRVSCIEHYRAQLLRQRELSHDGWTYILPFVPGIGLVILARAFEGRPPAQVAALIALAFIMFGAVLWIIARGRRRIEREIAAIAGE
jgi:hypothetical protein